MNSASNDSKSSSFNEGKDDANHARAKETEKDLKETVGGGERMKSKEKRKLEKLEKKRREIESEQEAREKARKLYF